MDAAELMRELDSGQLRPVYLFWGEDQAGREAALARLEARVDEGLGSFNVSRLNAPECGLSEVLDQARSQPFGRPPRVVAVKGVEAFKPEETARLKEYLDSPNEDAVLALIGQKPDFRLGLYKALKAQGSVVEFAPPRGRGLSAWVAEHARGLGCAMDRQAVETLIARTGQNTAELVQELEKLSLLAGPGQAITQEMVKQAATFSATASVFELGDAIGQGRPGQALEALGELMVHEHGLRILAMVVRHFHLLFLARALIDQGQTSSAAKELKLPPFVARKYVDQARHLSPRRIKKGLVYLERTDKAMKSSGLPDRLIMERLVVGLATL